MKKFKQTGLLALTLTAALLFGACSGGDNTEAAIKEKLKGEYSKLRLLSFSEANEKFDLISEECLISENSLEPSEYFQAVFVELDGDIRIIDLHMKKQGAKNELVNISEPYFVSELKAECFNEQN